jgi:hypothetical protein
MLVEAKKLLMRGSGETVDVLVNNVYMTIGQYSAILNQGYVKWIVAGNYDC